MKEAIQFFKLHEINDIKLILDSPFGLSEFEYLYDELREIVDAWELVEKFGGLKGAKIKYKLIADYGAPYWINVEKSIALAGEVGRLKEEG